MMQQHRINLKLWFWMSDSSTGGSYCKLSKHCKLFWVSKSLPSRRDLRKWVESFCEFCEPIVLWPCWLSSRLVSCKCKLSLSLYSDLHVSLYRDAWILSSSESCCQVSKYIYLILENVLQALTILHSRSASWFTNC